MGAVMADQKKDLTEYVVLVNDPDGTNDLDWRQIGTVKASSGPTAKRLALALGHPEGGTVVAVPVRSWEPEDLKPKLSFG
jgi:hypothetical protein